MKFGSVMHIGAFSESTIKIANFQKSKMVAAAILKIKNCDFSTTV